MMLTFHAGDLDSPDVHELVETHYAELRAISPPDACHVLPTVGLKDPAVTFWSVRNDGELVGMGALKELAPNHGEVKSMRAAPAAVGRGVGRAILRHIVAEGRSRGYARISLETGNTEPFTPALRLYESEGFTPWGPFGDYHDIPFSSFLSRQL
jgi:putative acetyltransferase